MYIFNYYLEKVNKKNDSYVLSESVNFTSLSDLMKEVESIKKKIHEDKDLIGNILKNSKPLYDLADARTKSKFKDLLYILKELDRGFSLTEDIEETKLILGLIKEIKYRN